MYILVDSLMQWKFLVLLLGLLLLHPCCYFLEFLHAWCILYHKSFGILVPLPGIQPVSSPVETQIVNHWATWSSSWKCSDCLISFHRYLSLLSIFSAWKNFFNLVFQNAIVKCLFHLPEYLPGIFVLNQIFTLDWILEHFCILCATPWIAHQAPRSLGFSRQEHWSGLPFPSPMHESEKWKWSRSVVSDSLWPHGLQPTSLLSPWDFPGKSTGAGCHCLLRFTTDSPGKPYCSISLN